MKVNISDYKTDSIGRDIEVEINSYDVIDLQQTLSHIIHPMLIKLKEIKSGYPHTDIEDAPQFPDEVMSGGATGYSNDRWNFILDEMIWTFGIIVEDRTDETWGNQADRDRLNNGLRLFGKYYLALWD